MVIVTVTHDSENVDLKFSVTKLKYCDETANHPRTPLLISIGKIHINNSINLWFYKKLPKYYVLKNITL